MKDRFNILNKNEVFNLYLKIDDMERKRKTKVYRIKKKQAILHLILYDSILFNSNLACEIGLI